VCIALNINLYMNKIDSTVGKRYYLCYQIKEGREDLQNLIISLRDIINIYSKYHNKFNVTDSTYVFDLYKISPNDWCNITINVFYDDKCNYFNFIFQTSRFRNLTNKPLKSFIIDLKEFNEEFIRVFRVSKKNIEELKNIFNKLEYDFLVF